MWAEKQRPLFDGLVIGTIVGLGLGTGVYAFYAWPFDYSTASKRCHEVVVRIDDSADVSARCPPETYVDVEGDRVVCRCGVRRQPISIQHPMLEFSTPEEIRPIPNVEPDTKHVPDAGMEL